MDNADLVIKAVDTFLHLPEIGAAASEVRECEER
jgi:hypothetical protein